MRIELVYNTSMAKRFNFLDINSIRPIVKLSLKFKKSGRALDLGSGIGRHSLFLAKNGFKVVAVDNKSEALTGLKELARLQKLPIKVVRVDAATYHTKQKFDVLLSNMLLHFIPEKKQLQIVKNMQQATKKDGIIVVSSYTNKNPKNLRPYPIKAGMLKKWYERAGWKILFYQEVLGEPIPDINNPKKMLRIWKEEIIAQKP